MKKSGSEPNNQEAERWIVGVILNDEENEVRDNIFLELGEEDFYNEDLRFVFYACYTLWMNKKQIDFVTVMEKLEGEKAYNGGLGLLTTLRRESFSLVGYEHHVQILKDCTAARRCREIGKGLYSATGSGTESLIERAVTDLSSIGERRKFEVMSCAESIDETTEYLEKIQQGKRDEEGVRTPYLKLNHYIGCFQKGELIVIAARPGVGKSALVSEVILHAALEEKKHIALFNLEMSKRQILLRMYANRLNVSLYDLMKGRYDKVTLGRVTDVLKSAEMYVDDESFSLERIVKLCRILARRKKLDMVCIDYLQLMETETEKKDRRLAVEYMSRRLKLLAKELNVPVIALSQMNRAIEYGDKREPTLADLRESGAIEQDASQVLFLYQNKEREAELGFENEIQKYVELHIAKNRQGATGKMYMKFQADKMRFIEIEKDGSMLIEKARQERITPYAGKLPWERESE